MASTPCAACKLLRRKCTQECVFAPYFPPTNPQKFICVHKVFGASNVTKILNDLPPINREDAVNSLYYEAEARLRDPIYGCVGPISFMQQYYKRIQQDLMNAKEELAGYLGQDVNVLHNQQQQVPSYIPPLGNNNTNQPNNFMMSMDGMPHGVIMPQGESMIPQHHHDHHHNDHELNLDAQRMAAMILDRGDHHHHHQQQQQQQGMFNGYGIDNNGSVTATGYNQMDVNDHNHHGGGGVGGSLCGPSLALGSFGGHEGYDQMGQETEHHDHMNHHDHDHNHQLQTQLMLQPPLQEGQDQQSEGGFLLGQETLHEEVEDDQEELGPPVKLRKSENKDTSSY